MQCNMMHGDGNTEPRRRKTNTGLSGPHQKYLRGLGEPPCLDGNDAEYQDFRTSFRIHMSLVSTVSQQLMDGSEVERNLPGSSASAG